MRRSSCSPWRGEAREGGGRSGAVRAAAGRPVRPGGSSGGRSGSRSGSSPSPRGSPSAFETARPRPNRARPVRGPALPRALAGALLPRRALRAASTPSRRTCAAPSPASATGSSPRPASSRRGATGGKATACALHRRAFEHPTRPEPALEAVLTLAGSRIDSIQDARGRDLGVLVLEPELVGALLRPATASSASSCGVDELPPHVVDAVLAVEDQRFFDHQGVDVLRILGRRSARTCARADVDPGREHPHPAAREELLPDARAEPSTASSRKPGCR